MKKLRLDVDDVVVDSFPVSEQRTAQGTVHAHTGELGGETCYYNCTHIDNMCSANCTGIGVECYTANQQYYACSAEPCTGAAACTRGTCQTYHLEDETC